MANQMHLGNTVWPELRCKTVSCGSADRCFESFTGSFGYHASSGQATQGGLGNLAPVVFDEEEVCH